MGEHLHYITLDCAGVFDEVVTASALRAHLSNDSIKAPTWCLHPAVETAGDK